MRRILSGLTILLLGGMLLVVASGMPSFGDPESPVHNALPERFIQEGPTETGSVNIVAAVILDYRAYDTLGEATVLFTAVAATLAALAATAAKKRGSHGK